jgi:hypothetical protein
VSEHLRHRLPGRAAVHLALHYLRADADVVPPGVVVPEFSMGVRVSINTPSMSNTTARKTTFCTICIQNMIYAFFCRFLNI